jgi:N,N'-diacetyllegionaminate synthase
MIKKSLLEEGKTLIIAEVGSNHFGDIGLAKESVAAAKEAGADVVKFQLYRAEELVDDKMPVLKYITQTHDTQRERFKSLQFDQKIFTELADLAEAAGLHYLVTPFYPDAVEFLNPMVPAFKVASGDMTNKQLIDVCVATGKPVIVSTGLSSLGEVDWMVDQVPEEQLHILHCVGVYPTPDDQVSLNTIPYLAKRYDQPIGYSDHGRGFTAPVAAVALGAHIIEKHFMADLSVPVADKDLSIGVADFKAMVSEIRRVEKMRGVEEKELQEGEGYFQSTLRRSIYAKRDIPANTPIEKDWLIPLRPWSKEAVSPSDLDDLVGRKINTLVSANTPILKSDLVP